MNHDADFRKPALPGWPTLSPTGLPWTQTLEFFRDRTSRDK
jgi:hypothetical protein